MQSPFPSWERVRVRLGTATLWIFHARDGLPWGDLAPRYWRGELAGLQTLRSSPHTSVERADLGRPAGTCIFKWFRHVGWWDTCKQWRRGTRGRRAVVRGEELRAAGFRAPASFCLIEKCRLGLPFDSAFIAVEEAGAPSLRQWLQPAPDLLGRYWEGEPAAFPVRGRRALVAAFGAEMARLHGAGIEHADARMGNILARWRAGRWEFIWIDNEGNRRHGRMTPIQRRRNLVQANMDRGLTPADRLRFWRAYARTAGFSREEARTLRDDVARETRRRWRKRGWI